MPRSTTAEGFAGELSKMVTEGWTNRVIMGIQAAISASFKTDQVLRPVMTKSEVKARFEICTEGFCIMRKDLKWSVPKIIDELPAYLRCKLDRIDWTPDEDRATWIV